MGKNCPGFISWTYSDKPSFKIYNIELSYYYSGTSVYLITYK